MSITAMKLALEALESASRIMDANAQQRQDEAITTLRTAIAEAEKQEPVVIKWTLDGDKDCHYNNYVGETPFGRILITWKGWKNHPNAEVEEFPGEFSAYGTSDEVKAACEVEFMRRINRLPQPAPKQESVDVIATMNTIRSRMEGYTAAPVQAQPAKPLPIERLREIERQHVYSQTATLIEFARAIEAAHGIKEQSTPLEVQLVDTLLGQMEAQERKPLKLIESLQVAQPCCGEYATCHRPCTPRGSYLATVGQERKPLTDEHAPRGSLEFEQWAEYVSLDMSKDADGYYNSETTDMAWQAWEMSKHEKVTVSPPASPPPSDRPLRPETR